MYSEGFPSFYCRYRRFTAIKLVYKVTQFADNVHIASFTSSMNGRIATVLVHKCSGFESTGNRTITDNIKLARSRFKHFHSRECLRNFFYFTIFQWLNEWPNGQGFFSVRTSVGDFELRVLKDQKNNNNHVSGRNLRAHLSTVVFIFGFFRFSFNRYTNTRILYIHHIVHTRWSVCQNHRKVKWYPLMLCVSL